MSPVDVALCLKASFSILFSDHPMNQICMGLLVKSLVQVPKLRPACLVPLLLSVWLPPHRSHLQPHLFQWVSVSSSSSFWLQRLTGALIQLLWPKCSQAPCWRIRQGLRHTLGCRVSDLGQAAF